MFAEIVSALLGLLGTAFLGAIGWAIQTSNNLSNRISVVETKDEGIKDLIESKFAEVNRRLSRIEIAMNGSLRGHE